MKALTLWQPWASMIAYGGKHIETRSWTTAYRGWLLIHAASTYPMDRQMLVEQEPFRSVFHGHGVTMMNAVHTDIPRRAVHAVAKLVHITPTDDLRQGQVLTLPKGRTFGATHTWELTEREWGAGNYEPRRFAWLLSDITRLTLPVMATGRQTLWTPKPETIKAVEDDLLGRAHHGVATWSELPEDWK